MPRTPKTPFDDDDGDSSHGLPPCGTMNKDGSIVGGGPRNIHCSSCRDAGYPSEYGHGHRKGQRKFCPVLQSLDMDAASDRQLDPLLKKIADSDLPTEHSKKPQSTSSLSEVLKTLEGLTADEILVHLMEGQCSGPHAKMALLVATCV